MAGIIVPQVPGLPDGVVSYDEAAMDAFATAYLQAASEPSWKQFLFGWAPVQVFDAVLEPSSMVIPPPGFLHLLFEGGYWGGAWLRSVLRAAQPDGMLSKVGIAPDAAGLEAAGAKARAALDAAAGDAAAALAHSEAHLAEHVAGFGYNLGYLLEIVEFPPDGAPDRQGYVREAGLLRAEYETDHLTSTAALRQIAEQLDDPSLDAWSSLADDLAASRDGELLRGRQVWSTGLSAQGLEDDDYDQLLDVSASFLEVMQATALTTCQAVVERDAEAARRAALATAGIAPWLAAYGAGLMDPVRDEDAGAEWPRFED